MRATLGLGRGWASGRRQGGRDHLAPCSFLILAHSPQRLLSLSSLPLSLLHAFQILLQLGLRLQQLLHLQTEQGTRDVSASLKQRLAVPGPSAQGSSRKNQRARPPHFCADEAADGPFWVTLGARGRLVAQPVTEHPPVPAVARSRAAARGAGPALTGATGPGTGISQGHTVR